MEEASRSELEMGRAPGYLLDNLIQFGRLLCWLGMDVGPDRMMDVIRALGCVDVGSKTDFYHATRSVLVSRKEHLPLFDVAFEAFWQGFADGRPRSMVRASGTLPRQARPVVLPPSLHSSNGREDGNRKRDPMEDQQAPIIEATATYSARAALRTKDFAEMTPEELHEIKQLIASFVWRLGERRTRRYRPGGEIRIDMRRTVRRNLRYGGEIIQWAYRRAIFKPRPLVLLADISGSMDRYTRLVIRFCYSVARSLRQPVEVFVFSTHLTRVTRQLRRRDVDLALAEVGQTVTDWSGGTRIGEALRAFNFDWGQRVLGRGAVAILISDGWDRGDVDLLEREMARLHRLCYRLIWLNPLLGASSYEPAARGMQAALPHVDDFLPVHNLESLEKLADHLETLGRTSDSGRNHARRAF